MAYQQGFGHSQDPNFQHGQQYRATSSYQQASMRPNPPAQNSSSQPIGAPVNAAYSAPSPPLGYDYNSSAQGFTYPAFHNNYSPAYPREFSYGDPCLQAHPSLNTNNDHPIMQQPPTNSYQGHAVTISNCNIDPRILTPQPHVPTPQQPPRQARFPTTQTSTTSAVSPPSISQASSMREQRPSYSIPRVARPARSLVDAQPQGAIEKPPTNGVKQTGQRCLTCIAKDRYCAGNMVGDSCADCVHHGCQCHWYDPKNGILSYHDVNVQILQQDQPSNAAILSTQVASQSSPIATTQDSGNANPFTVSAIDATTPDWMGAMYRKGSCELRDRPRPYDPIKALMKVYSVRGQYYLKREASIIVRTGRATEDPEANVRLIGSRIWTLMNQNKSSPNGNKLAHDAYWMILPPLMDAAKMRWHLSNDLLREWAEDWEDEYGSRTN